MFRLSVHFKVSFNQNGVFHYEIFDKKILEGILEMPAYEEISILAGMWVFSENKRVFTELTFFIS